MLRRKNHIGEIRPVQKKYVDEVQIPCVLSRFSYIWVFEAVHVGEYSTHGDMGQMYK